MRYKHIEVTVDKPDASLSLGEIKAFVRLARNARIPDDFAVVVDGNGPTSIEVSEPIHDRDDYDPESHDD